MNTNKFFSFNRCWLLLRNDLLINHKKYLLTILGAFVVGYVYMYMKMPKVHGESVYNNARVFVFGSQQYSSIFFTYILALGAFVGLAFPQLNNKVNTSNYLLMPASTFEKFMVQFLIRIIAGLSIFLTLFWLDAHLARLSALSAFEGDQTLAIEPFNYSMIIIIKKLFATLLIPTVLFAIGIYLFSIRVFFKRFALVKTILTFTAISVIFIFILSVCSHVFFPVHTNTHGIYVNYGELFPPFSWTKLDNLQIFSLLLFGLCPVFLLPISYHKLKEKQV